MVMQHVQVQWRGGRGSLVRICDLRLRLPAVLDQTRFTHRSKDRWRPQADKTIVRKRPFRIVKPDTRWMMDRSKTVIVMESR